MANQISATVYQVDGSPQPSVKIISFLTGNILVKEATISTISEVTAVIQYYSNPNNPTSFQSYYVSESITDLVAAANTGTFSLLQATVLSVNGYSNASLQYAFPANNITIWANVLVDTNSFIQFNGNKYYVTETEAVLLALSNTVTTGSEGPQGVEGPAGPQGVAGPVGPAGLTWRGAWVSGTSYSSDDAVGYNGASWFCISATSGTTTPILDTTHWALLAAQGATGATGATGAQGPTGATGAAGSSATSAYKVYTAKVSYSGTFTISILQNTIGTITWSNPSINSYLKLASSALFTLNKTIVMSAVVENGGVPYFVLNSTLSGTSDLFIQFIKFDGTASSTPFFDNLILEIRVYN